MLLEEEEYKFDFVVSALSFDMRNKDAYDHMLEQLSIKAGVPPITMSSDDSGSVVMKGVTRGAGGYLIKPIGMQAIQNICQHVAQKWRNELKHSGSIDGRGQHLKSSKIWSYQINCQFNAALLQLGVNEDSAEAVPEKILELMNAPELTLEDVASHLQETRLELEKMKRGQNVSIKAQAKLKAKAEVSVPCPKPPVMGPSDNDFHGIYIGVADCRPWGAYGWDFDFLKSLHGNLSLSPSVCGHQGSSTSSQKNEKNSCDDMKKENERGNETGADLSSPLKRIKIFL
ncbi:Signal transduction response regulator [Macleaya cordata]|uniref:Signal transduction response regulator n=1 Tax=Macleaya cordata TaxID=56857 RepID=A0A200R7Y6_MACCD|nr:Signal transduction response regulator [Macleaya cordata]